MDSNANIINDNHNTHQQYRYYMIGQVHAEYTQENTEEITGVQNQNPYETTETKNDKSEEKKKTSIIKQGKEEIVGEKHKLW